ncbi:MAG TPA: LamG-like jellyroll fold domain-containing protein [Verrucomicrobiae bacterium]|nr:LamG-like jellyroll fold domain-containing protein [Verrucomicrobiae bacterium]
MNKTLFSMVMAGPILVMAATSVRADYSAAIMSLNPVAYWPLNETNLPPQTFLAHNSGTLGSQANGFYNDVYLNSGAGYTLDSAFTGPVPGVTSDGDAAAFFNGGTNSDDNDGYMIVPDINRGLEMGGRPFTAELWVKPGGGDPNDPTGTSFASTEWTSLMEKGGGGWAYAPSGDSAGNSYGWSIELAGIYCLGYYTNGPMGWYTPGPVFYTTNALWVVDFYSGNGGNTPSLEFDVPMYEPTPQWFHLALTYDGTNANFYTNGVLAATTLPNLPQSTNYVIQAGSAAPVPTQNYAFSGGYSPDTNNPMVIGNINPDSSLINSGFPSTAGGTIGFNCQNYNGVMDELAYYSNALSGAAILKHYQDATASDTTLYTNDVLSANPLVYFRFDDAKSVFTQPPANFSTFPVATNYGSMGAAGNGLVQSGVVPNVPGTPEIGFGSRTNAVQINGFDATVDVGGGHLAGTALDPTNLASMSLVYWFKANPADCYGRFQTILGRGDNAWRSSLDGGGHLRWNPGAGPELSSTATYNDGLWHQVVGVADGSSGTVSLYVDGQLSTSSGGMGALGGGIHDLLIGGAPDYTASEPARDFAGQIAQVAFYTNALNAAQAAALYADATNLAPVITGVSPTNISVSATMSASFTVFASGQPVTYQWYQGTTMVSNVPGNVSGATNATLAFSNAIPGDQGSYSVVVANSFGSVTSAVVSLTVITNVEITSDISDTNLTLFAGGKSTFSIGTAGAPPITYQWYSNNVAIGGATGSSYQLVNAQPGNTTNFYYCITKNSYVSATSSVAQVTILPDPTATYPLAVLAANPVGFWRLNEGPDNGSGNDGVIAHDYWGGNNGIYTNSTLAQPGYNNVSETNETSVLFGISTFQDGDVFAIPATVDFSATNGGVSNFSIEAWVKGDFSQSSDAGLVSKGWGGGGEQFDMDCGNDATNAQNPYLHSYRFFVHDATGGTHGVGSNVNPNDNLWHHLVGVCNESQGFVAFYIDGLLAGTNSIGTNSGILASSRSMLIGSRPSNQSTNNNDDQFTGWIDDVAVYNYALTAAAISNQFVSADIPALVAVQPTGETVGQNANVTFSAVASGTPVILYQWYDSNTGLPVPASATQGGSTNATLILTDVQSSASYFLIVSNAYGINQSTTVPLTVVSGLAQIYESPQSQYFVFEGDTLQIPAAAYGTLPLGFQWQYSPTNAIVWTSLTDNGNIIGSQSNVLTIASGQPANGGYYQLVITNSYGSVTSIVAQVTVGTLPAGFNGNGLGWSANSAGTYDVPQFTNGVLYLTDTNNGETRSSFFPAPLYIGAFEASFTYQNPSRGGADGMSFCIQNDPRGAGALGGGGGGLGVNGITPSVELELNLYTGNTEQAGYTLLTDGLTGAGGANGNYQKPGTVSITSGDPINITVYYSNGQADITFTDAVASTSFSASYAINIPSVVGGNTAYVGFTGADGGVNSLQTITNFTFVSLVNESIQSQGNTVQIAWPQFAPGYALQVSTNLLNPNWVNVANAPVITNGLFRVTVPIGQGAKFYRLNLP